MRERNLLEAALAGHGAISDCAVLERANERGERELVAYVVSAEPVPREELDRLLDRALSTSAATLPRSFVRLSALPLDPAGRVDDAALMRLPVVDDDLARRWQARLASLGAASKAAALVAERHPGSLPLHLADVLSQCPQWRQWSKSRSQTAGRADAGESEDDAPPPLSSSAGRRLARSDGGPLDSDDLGTLADVLRRAAACDDDFGIVFLSEDGSESFQSYSRLLAGAEQLVSGLRALGLEPSDRVLLQIPSSRDFLESFWACILAGFIPVPLAFPRSYESSAAREALANAWRALERPLVLTSEELVSELREAARAEGLEGFRVQALESCRLEPDRRSHPARPGDDALYMLTSGSTGLPKAVRLSHRNLLSRTVASERMNELSAADVSLNWMPLDHVAGLIYFHIRDVYLRCRQVQVPTASVLHDPLLWLDAIDRFRVTVTFAPNFAFGLVNEREREIAERKWDLSCVRFVLNGAEAIVARTARKFLRLLEPQRLAPDCMRPAWGMSETSSGVTYSDSFSLESTSDEDAFVEVGRPVPGLSLRIVDGEGRVVEEGRVGALQVRGAPVTRGYFRNDAATGAAFTDDGWFRTGDLALIRDGRLTITGREKDVIIVNGVNYYSHSIESAVEEVEGVHPSFTAACAVRDRGSDTDRLAIFFCPQSFAPEPLRDLLGRVRSSVRGRTGIGPDYLVPVGTGEIPKTSLGKIQRTRLRQGLAEGEFDEALKLADRLAENANCVPDWFYRRTWRRERVSRERSLPWREPALIFADSEGLAEALRASLAAEGIPSRMVQPGSSFRSDAGTYWIDPSSPGDYRRLVDSIAEEGLAPGHVFHVWGYRRYQGEVRSAEGIEWAQERGSLSLLFLAQALLRNRSPAANALGVTVVSNHTADVGPTGPLAYEKSPVLGLVRSIPQEAPSLQLRHVDLDETDPERAARLALRESRLPSRYREVAYRRGERFVAGIEKADFERDTESALPFERGGMYLVAGGLGGLGAHVARYLLDEHDARLLLVGRRAPSASPDRAGALEELRRAGGALAYQAVDVRDRERLWEVVARYETEWSRKLAGVFHFAGDYRESLVGEESREGVLEMLGARALGACHLHALLEERGGGIFIASSSVAAFFGGASIAAYSAASGFLEAFSRHHARRAGISHFCFLWSNWEDVGQSRGYRGDLPRSHGYRPMPASQALQSMLVGLAHGERSLLVGLDGEHRHVRPFVESAPSTLDAVHVFCAPSRAPSLASELENAAVFDRFGTATRCELVVLPEIPVTESGEVDAARLLQHSRERGARSARGGRPESEPEVRLAEIWKRVLAVPEVGLEDDFFDLGGDSLLAVRVSSQVRDVFGCDVSLKTIFEATTLRQLAAALSLAPSAPESGGAARSRSADPRSLLERLDEIPDDEVEALLIRMSEEDEARR